MASTAQRQIDELMADFEGTAYRLVHPLAHGGMGSVFVAEHVKLARPCVIKLLLPALSKQPEIIERLIVEGRILANIEHENLVKVTDLSATPGGRAFIAMELLTGTTLRELLAERTALPPLEAIDILSQVLRGLGAAHAGQVIHRDVKLDNLFVCAANADGRRVVKVLDFGIAKVLSASLKGDAKFPTAEGMILGTPTFMSPEQAMARPVDARSDVYSAGVVLFRALTGQSPFTVARTLDRERAMVELFKMHVERAPPTPSAVAPQPISPDLDACVLKALAKHPDDRYQSAAEFAAALKQVVDGIKAEVAAGTARRPPPSRTEPMPRPEVESSAAVSTTPAAKTRPLRWAERVKPPKRRSGPVGVYIVIMFASAAVFTVALLALVNWMRTR